MMHFIVRNVTARQKNEGGTTETSKFPNHEPQSFTTQRLLPNSEELSCDVYLLSNHSPTYHSRLRPSQGPYTQRATMQT